MVGLESVLSTFLNLQVSLAVQDQSLSTAPMWQPFSSPMFCLFLNEAVRLLTYVGVLLT